MEATLILVFTLLVVLDAVMTLERLDMGWPMRQRNPVLETVFTWHPSPKRTLRAVTGYFAACWVFGLGFAYWAAGVLASSWVLVLAMVLLIAVAGWSAFLNLTHDAISNPFDFGDF